MKKRDKAIIEALEKFRVLNRDQIAEMFFGNLKQPITNANFALKRLRDRGYIDANINRQPYVYFAKSNKMARDSQKIDHFLAIADFYIQLKKEGGSLKFYHVEPEYMDRGLRPDVCMSWKGRIWFVEIQRTAYTSKYMTDKLERYNKFYQSNKWRELPFTKELFPYVWIVSDYFYKDIKRDFLVFQSKDVQDFLIKIAKPSK